MSEQYCSKPACDGNKFFVEVSGLHHGNEQGFEFYDRTDMSQQLSLESKKETELVLDDSTIYSWDWHNETENRNVWLKVEAEHGPIKLPLFQNVSAVGLREDEQSYLVHAVLPLTLLPTYYHSQDARRFRLPQKSDQEVLKARLAPVRAGFIYIFYNNRAWREIEIRPDESQNTFSLKDVDLFQYRSGRDKPFKSGARMATGAPLQELWIPAKENNKAVDIRVAFSEVQWSAARLNYLEADHNELAQRAFAFNQLNVFDNSKVLKVKSLPVMRRREPERELFIAEPGKLNRDLSGEWLQQTYRQIRQDILSANADGKKASEIHHTHQEYQYEYAMKQSALQEILAGGAVSDDTTASKRDDPAELWYAAKSKDYLEEAKTRRLRAIVLDDPLFDVRHHAFLVIYGVGYLQQVYADMSRQQYYRCAEAVQQFVLPPKFGRQDNPLHAHMNEMDHIWTGTFHRTLRTYERQACKQDLTKLQQQLQSLLEDPRLAQVLPDVSSQDETDGAAAHALVGYGMRALSFNVAQLVKMPGERTKADPPFPVCHTTINNIMTGDKNNLLHSILFPPETSISLDQESYEVPLPYNSGSGLASPESLAQWALDEFDTEDHALQVHALQTMDLTFMEPLTDNGESLGFGMTRRIAGVTNSILSGYFDALQSLSPLINELAEEAQVLQFNKAYAPLLRLMKGSHPKMWGDITYQPVGATMKPGFKGIVIGVHGHGLEFGLSAAERKVYAENRAKGPMARLYDNDGVLASSGKNAYSKSQRSKGLGPKEALKVVVVSQDNPAAKALSKTYTHRTMDALQDVNKPGVHKSNAYEKLRVPYFIVVIELINLRNNWRHVENFLDDKDWYYSGANAFSVALDLGIALTHAGNMLTDNASRLARTSNTTLITFSDKTITRFTFQEGKVTLNRNISRLGVISIVAGLLTAGIAAWDAVRLFREGDTNAAVAMSMIAVGSAITTVAAMFSTTAPLLFGMGPVAWLGIAIAISGAVLYRFFKDTPIDIWLKHGPFGGTPNEKYRHLQDPAVAFERLLGLLFSFSAKTYRLRYETDFSESFIKTMELKGVTHVIHINTNLMALLDPKTITPYIYVRQAYQETKTLVQNRGASRDIQHRTVVAQTVIEPDKQDLTIIDRMTTQEGYLLFVNYNRIVPTYKIEKLKRRDSNYRFRLNNKADEEFQGGVYSYSYRPVYEIRARIAAQGTFFPIPAPETPEPQQSGVSATDRPQFTPQEQGWLNETTLIRLH